MLALTLSNDGNANLSPLAVTNLITINIITLILCLLRTEGGGHTLFDLGLFHAHAFSLNLTKDFTKHVNDNVLPFVAPIFLRVNLNFSPFRTKLVVVPVILNDVKVGQVIMRIIGHFNCHQMLMTAALNLSLIALLFVAATLLN